MTTTITHETVLQRVAEALEEFGAEPTAIDPEATFEALDVDSLDLVELAQIVQESYGVEIKGEDMPKLKSVGDAVDFVIARVQS